jgi:transposase
VLVDTNGIPLALRLTPANVHDSQMFEELIDAVPPIRQCWGRPRKRPAKLHADKGYDYDHCRRAARRRSITPRIARRGVDSSERLGRHRWVVERTLAWFARFRRLTVRYERRLDILYALHFLAVNWKEDAAFGADIAAEVVGEAGVDRNPPAVMGSEDFAFMLQAKPGAFVWMGIGRAEEGRLIHTPIYDFNDEALPYGASYWARLTERVLSEHAGPAEGVS